MRGSGGGVFIVTVFEGVHVLLVAVISESHLAQTVSSNMMKNDVVLHL